MQRDGQITLRTEATTGIGRAAAAMFRNQQVKALAVRRQDPARLYTPPDDLAAAGWYTGRRPADMPQDRMARAARRDEPFGTPGIPGRHFTEMSQAVGTAAPAHRFIQSRENTSAWPVPTLRGGSALHGAERAVNAARSPLCASRAALVAPFSPN
ncbi:MAG: hypothetical protein AAFQ58_08545 [Pseudomonadota bacterium]